MTQDRAKQLLENLSPFGEFVGITKSEDAFIRSVWQTMPGYTCYYDALVRIARNEV